MTTTPHPYADILRAIADGQPIQWEASNGKWQPKGRHTTLHEIAEETYVPARYRIAHHTITVNSIEVPEPLREAPQAGTTVFLVVPSEKTMIIALVWSGKPQQTRYLQRGLLHSTPAAARAHGEAILAASSTEDYDF